MKVKALQSIGIYATGAIIAVAADKDVAQMIKDGKTVDVLTETRAKELLEAGVIEEVVEDDEQPVAKTTAKTTTAKATTKAESPASETTTE